MDINGNRTIDLNSFFEIYRLADTHNNFALSASLVSSSSPPIITQTSSGSQRKLSLTLPGQFLSHSYTRIVL